MNTHYYYQPTSASPKQSRFRQFIGLTIAVSVLAILVRIILIGLPVFNVSSLASAKPPQSTQTTLNFTNSVNSIIQKNSQYQIGVALINLSNGQSQTFGITTPFEAASTAKILTACAYYHLAETGQVSLDNQLGTYDAQFQLQQMVNDSNNDSWSVLINAIGEDNLQAYATSIGITYDENTNTLSPLAMATLLKKLYDGELLNQVDTKQLLSYMQNTNDEALIPAAIPSLVTVYHKYGLLNGELHDAAILTKNNQAYTLVIYTKGAVDDSDDDQRTEIIHQLTQAITSSLFS